MKKWILSTILVAAVVASAVVFLPAKQVQAACGTILTGSYASSATPQTSATFYVLAGDVVTATNTDSAGTATNVNVEITINGFTTSGGGANVTMTRSATAAASGSGSVFFSNLNGSGGQQNWTISISGPNCPQTPLAFVDGRVNTDAWATAVVYCIAGDINIYAVDNESVGRLAFVVTEEEIAEVGVPSETTVLDSFAGALGQVTLYRLSSGQFQVVAPDTQPGKSYSFVFNGC